MRRKLASLLTAVVAAGGLMFVGVSTASAAAYPPITGNHEIVQTCNSLSGVQTMRINYTVTDAGVTSDGRYHNWTFQLNGLYFFGPSLYDWTASMTYEGFDGVSSLIYKNIGGAAFNVTWPQGATGPKGPSSNRIDGLQTDFTPNSFRTKGPTNTRNFDPTFFHSAFRNIRNGQVKVDCQGSTDLRLRHFFHMPDSQVTGTDYIGGGSCDPTQEPAGAPLDPTANVIYSMQIDYDILPLAPDQVSNYPPDTYQMQVTDAIFSSHVKDPSQQALQQYPWHGLKVEVVDSDNIRRTLNPNTDNWHRADHNQTPYGFHETDGVNGVEFPFMPVRITPGGQRPYIEYSFTPSTGVFENPPCLAPRQYISQDGGWTPNNPPLPPASFNFTDCANAGAVAQVVITTQWEDNEVDINLRKLASLTIKNASKATLKFDKGTATSNAGVYVTTNGFDRVTAWTGRTTGDLQIAPGATKTFGLTSLYDWVLTSDPNYSSNYNHPAPYFIDLDQSLNEQPSVNATMKAYNGTTLCNTGVDLNQMISSSDPT